MKAVPARATAHHRQEYRRFFDMETRWNDMDLYGHMNNVVYMEYFDSALNRVLIEAGALDLHGEGPIGVVAQSYTNYGTVKLTSRRSAYAIFQHDPSHS